VINALLTQLVGFWPCLPAAQEDAACQARILAASGITVTAESLNILLPEARLALAWSPPKIRGPLNIALQFDRRLSRIVSRTNEPMLGQMRLAWWRDALRTAPAARPRGDAVLHGIGVHWQGREEALAAMVDGWEVLIAAERIGANEIASFATGRSAFFGALLEDSAGLGFDRVVAAGRRWALADAAASISDAVERAALIEAGLSSSHEGGRMPRALRGLAVLDALARRSLQCGGRPLMEGRGSALTALRAVIFLS
jgi:phytoene synthase